MMWSVYRRLGSFIPSRSRWALGVLGLESLLAGVLEAGLLVLVVAVAATVATGEGALTVPVPLLGDDELHANAALALAGSVTIAVLVLHLHIAALTARVSSAVLGAARDQTIIAFTRATWARQAHEREGSLQETVSTLASQTSTLVVQLANLAGAAFGLLAFLVAAVIVDPLVTLVVVGLGAALFACFRPIGRLTRSRSRHYVNENSAFVEDMTQWGNLAMDLRVFGVGDIEADRLMTTSRGVTTALRRTRFIKLLGSNLFGDLAILFMVAAVAGLYLARDIDIAAAGAVVVLIVRSLSYGQQANTAMQGVNDLSPNLEALKARLGSLTEDDARYGTTKMQAITSIEFDAVRYEYGPDRPGVDGLTFEIHRGEAIGIVGPSGSGKSTLVQVLLRLREPTAGVVRVSGIPYADIDPTSWHDLIALVPQEPRLFQGTIAENVRFFRNGIDAHALEAAMAAAHVLEEVRRLPESLNTRLGPRGSGLSGGQKQRLAIARALVGTPQLLVLDEPTSALDSRSEQLLQRTIEELKGQVTLVIIAHRTSTLACCDRVIAMAEGHVAMIGSLDEAVGVGLKTRMHE